MEDSFMKKSFGMTGIIGVIISTVGLILIVYGNSQNNNIGAQLSSLFGSGKTNPGTPWMIFGGAALGLGIILVIKTLFLDKE
jgi:drug/metabolite transporter (DMT)-like permease